MSGRPETTNLIPGRSALSVGMPDLPAPPGWAWVKLTEIARLESGHTPSRGHPEYWDGDIPWIGIRDAREHHGGRIQSTHQQVTKAGLDNSAARLLPAGTVCLSRTASVGYVVVMGRPMATSQDFVNWVCGPDIEPEFLKYLLIAEHDSLASFSKGSTHSTIYFPEVKAFHVCIPGIAEQRRIVSKVDQLLARCRSGRVALNDARLLREKHRQSVLASACSGELTSDFREHHVRSLGEGQLSTDDGDASEHLPLGWKNLPLAGVTSLVTSGSRAWTRYYRDDGSCTFIMAQNVRPLGLDLSVRTAIEPPPEDSERDRTQVRRGDLLVTIVGANTGDVCRVAVNLADHFVCQSVALIRPVSAENSDFMELWLASRSHGGGQLTEYAYGQGRPHLSLEQLRSIRVAIPPVKEQREIVRRVRAAFESIDRVMQAIDEAVESFTALEGAILFTAFRGALLLQDSAADPAPALPARPRERSAARPRRASSHSR